MTREDYSIQIYGKTYHLQLKIGEVTDTSSQTDIDIRTSGGGGTSFQGTGIQQSVQTEVTKTSFQRVFLTDEDGHDTVMKFKNFSFDCRPGNMVGAVALEPARDENKWVAIVNYSTGEVRYNNNAIENYTKSWVRSGLVFVVLALVLFFGLFVVARTWALLWLFVALFGGAMGMGVWQGRQIAKVRESASLKRAVEDLVALKNKL